MNICSGRNVAYKYTHEEIVYEGRTCPFCEYIMQANDDLNDIKKELEDAQKEIDKLNEEEAP